MKPEDFDKSVEFLSILQRIDISYKEFLYMKGISVLKKDIRNKMIVLTPESNLLKVDECFYYAAAELNLLCKYDLKKRKASIVSKIGKDSVFIKRAYRKLLLWRNKIVFIPYMGNKICLYNLQDCSWDEIIIRNQDIPYKFGIAEIYEDNIYVFGHYYPDLLKINLLNRIVQAYNLFKNNSDFKIYFGLQGTLENNFLYVPLCRKKEIFCLNMANGEFKFFTLNMNAKGITGICNQNGVFWGLDRSGSSIICWDKNFRCKEYDINRIFQFGDRDIFTTIIKCGNTIVVGSSTRRDILCIKNEVIQAIQTDSPLLQIDNFDEYKNFMVTLDGKVVFYDEDFNKKDQLLLEFNKKDLDIYIKEYEISIDDIKYLAFINETEAFDLSDFLHVNAFLL